MNPIDAISIQVYSLRALGPLDAILDVVAEAGYRHVELVGSHLEDPAATRARLDARGITPSSSHVSMATLREKPDAIAAACQKIGIVQLFMPSVPHEERGSAAPYWRALGSELARMADRFARHEINLGYHNHAFELAPKENTKTALDLIFEAAGSSPLTWEADVAWLVRGGAEPKALLHRYRNRLVAAHVKDIAPPGRNLDEDGWADVGAGVLDWRDLWHACRDAGARWMVVEHDKPADPARTVRSCYDYLSRIAA